MQGEGSLGNTKAGLPRFIGGETRTDGDGAKGVPLPADRCERLDPVAAARANIHNDHGKAKPYQVRPVLAAIETKEANP